MPIGPWHSCTAISTGNSKESALYFDYVIPAVVVGDIKGEGFPPSAAVIKSISNLLPNELRRAPGFRQSLMAVQKIGKKILETLYNPELVALRAKHWEADPPTRGK